MPILEPPTRQIIGFCYRIPNILGHGGMARIKVRRLDVGPGKGAGAFELDLKDVP